MMDLAAHELDAADLYRDGCELLVCDTVLATEVDEPACRKHESIEHLWIVRVVRDPRIPGDGE